MPHLLRRNQVRLVVLLRLGDLQVHRDQQSLHRLPSFSVVGSPNEVGVEGFTSSRCRRGWVGAGVWFTLKVGVVNTYLSHDPLKAGQHNLKASIKLPLEIREGNPQSRSTPIVSFTCSRSVASNGSHGLGNAWALIPKWRSEGCGSIVFLANTRWEMGLLNPALA